MKKMHIRPVVSLIILLLGLNTANARKLSRSEAWNRAHNIASMAVLKSSPAPASGNVTEPLYIFNDENGNGFLIAPGDDRFPAVLGYSDNGNIDVDNLPPGLSDLLDYYRLSITAADSGSPTESTASRQYIAPLIATQWGQHEPYNRNCPGVTGCVATAMAQIINYHQWPDSPVGKLEAYKTQTLGMNVAELPERQFNWSDMTDDEISWLMRYCGQSVYMDYAYNESGAFSPDAVKAFVEKFHYSRSAELTSPYGMTDDEWESLIYNELRNGRPVYYDGMSTGGGHAFIVDGYSDGLFHVNWGWDGSADGFFSLQNLNPGTSSYATGNAIIGICKAPSTFSAESCPVYVTGISADQTHLFRESPEEDFPPFNVSFTIASDLTGNATLEVGLAIINDEGEITDVLYNSTQEIPARGTVDINAEIAFGKGIGGDAIFKLYPVTRGNASGKWIMCEDADVYYLNLSIRSSTGVEITAVKPGDYERDYGRHNIDGITYRMFHYEGATQNYASVMPSEDGRKYSGNLYIPTTIEYDGMTFVVTGIEYDALSNSPELTGLSVPFVPEISDNDSLVTLEIRGGSFSGSGEIRNCKALTEIIYPENVYRVNLPLNCTSLKSLKFKCVDRIELRPSWRLSPWEVEGDWENFTDIYFASDCPPIYGDIYNNPYTPNAGWTIHVPAGCKEIYEQSQWGVCTIVEDMPARPVNYVDWNYGLELDESGYRHSYNYGCGANDVEMAIKLPASDISIYKGMSISSVKFVDGGDFPVPEYVFVANDPRGHIVKEAVPSFISDGDVMTWHTVRLSHPVVIGDDDLYIGIGRKSKISVELSQDETPIEGAAYLRTLGADNRGCFYVPGVWFEQSVSPFMISAVIEGDSYPTDIATFNAEIVPNPSVAKNVPPTAKSRDLSVKSAKSVDKPSAKSLGPDYFVKQTGNAGKHVAASADKVESDASTAGYKFRAKLVNRSPRIVKEITLAVNVGDGEPKNYKIPVFLPMNRVVDFETGINLDVDPEKLNGWLHMAKACITEADGEPDELPENGAAETEITIVEKAYPRKLVLEGVFGTWCPLSPLGMATMDYMASRHPGSIIPISIFFREEMGTHVNSYNEIYDGWTNVLYLNRQEIETEPFAVEGLLESAPATITAVAEFDNSNGITIKANAKFGFNEQDGDYRISCVLIEDGLGSYEQNNATYGNSSNGDNPDDYMNWWTKQDASVDYIYDNVARNVFGGYHGVAGLLPKNIEKDKEYSATMEFTVPDVFDNRDKIKLAVLLIDHKSGEIVNADVTEIQGTYRPVELPVKPADVAPAEYAISAMSDNIVSRDFRRIFSDVEFTESEDKVWITVPTGRMVDSWFNPPGEETNNSHDITFVANKTTVDGVTQLTLDLPQLVYKLPHANYYLVECVVKDTVDLPNYFNTDPDYGTLQRMKSQPVKFTLNENGEYETDRNLALYYDQRTVPYYGVYNMYIFRKAKLFPFNFSSDTEIPEDATLDEYSFSHYNAEGKFDDGPIYVFHKYEKYWFKGLTGGSIPLAGVLSEDKKSIDVKIPQLQYKHTDNRWSVFSKAEKISIHNPDLDQWYDDYYASDSSGSIRFMIDGDKIIPESALCLYETPREQGLYNYVYLNPVLTRRESSGVQDAGIGTGISETEYFSIDGKKLVEPAPGTFVIKMTHYNDGTVKTSKQIIR